MSKVVPCICSNSPRTISISMNCLRHHDCLLVSTSVNVFFFRSLSLKCNSKRIDQECLGPSSLLFQNSFKIWVCVFKCGIVFEMCFPSHDLAARYRPQKHPAYNWTGFIIHVNKRNWFVLLRFNSVIGFQSDFIYHDNWIARVQIEKRNSREPFYYSTPMIVQSTKAMVGKHSLRITCGR